MTKKKNSKNKQKAARKAAGEAAKEGAGGAEKGEKGRKVPLPRNDAAIVIHANSFESLKPDTLLDYVDATEKAGGAPFQHVVLYRYSEGVVECIVHTRDNPTSGVIRQRCASMEELHALLRGSLLDEDPLFGSPKRPPVSTSSSSVAVDLMRLLGGHFVEGLNPKAHVLELHENEGTFLPEGAEIAEMILVTPHTGEEQRFNDTHLHWFRRSGDVPRTQQSGAVLRTQQSGAVLRTQQSEAVLSQGYNGDQAVQDHPSHVFVQGPRFESVPPQGTRAYLGAHLHRGPLDRVTVGEPDGDGRVKIKHGDGSETTVLPSDLYEACKSYVM